MSCSSAAPCPVWVEVWGLAQGLQALFVQVWGAAMGEGGMVLGRELGRCSCCCPGCRTVLCPAR